MVQRRVQQIKLRHQLFVFVVKVDGFLMKAGIDAAHESPRIDDGRPLPGGGQ